MTLEFIKETIVEQCNGCNRIDEDYTCKAYVSPKAKWRNGTCNLASHAVEKETKIQDTDKYKPKKYGKKRRGR